MTRKRWSLTVAALLLAALSAIIALVVIVDPFEIYHRALFYNPPYESETQMYSVAGVARSYDYDSIIIGSSMTENFRPSQLDALLGGRFVKLCVNGGTPFNHKQMMDMAFSTHDVKRVFYGLDVDALSFFYITPKAEMPTYLYDDDLTNDVQYWFNQSVLFKYIPLCLSTRGQTDPDQRDTMYCWGDLYNYGKDAALAGLKFDKKQFKQEPPSETPTLSQQSMLNVEHNILPFVRENPDTQFIFFFPPYSAARWYEFYRQGQMGYHLNQKEAVIDALLPFDNVKIYDFHAETAWITDLDNYIDTWHYGPWISDSMAESISRGEYRITSVAQAQENNAVIRSLVDQIVAAGKWPDAFTY